MSSLSDWVNATPDRRREYEREALICAVAESIHAALDAEGKSQAVLATLLDCSESNVTQILNGQRNMTLRTLADIAHALGRRVTVTLESPGMETRSAPACGYCNDEPGYCKCCGGITCPIVGCKIKGKHEHAVIGPEMNR